MRGASHLGLLFIDLDRFKEINDRFGHDVGDRLLVEVSHTLTQCVRRGDMVSRLGGDEFAVILDSVGRTQNAEAVGKKILETLTEKSIVVGSRSINVGASIGLAIFPDHAEDAESLIKAADTAMYAVKTAGRNNLQSYGGEMQSEALRRTEIHQALGEALPKGEFSLHHQPQVVGLSGRITGVEALLRWTPESGPIGPDVFIPVAEEQDLISPIGAWVLRTACEQYCGWRDHGILPEKLVLGVNVSAGQLARGNEFPEAIERLLEEFDMQPGTLELEITETAVMHDARTAIEELRRINALGVRIALDDFGTGYSSLTHLQRLPVQTLKIDRSFVNDMTTAGGMSAGLVKGTLSLANIMGLTTVAEGVETEQERDFLAANGCAIMQGYLFHRPMSAQAFETLLIETRTDRNPATKDSYAVHGFRNPAIGVPIATV